MSNSDAKWANDTSTQDYHIRIDNLPWENGNQDYKSPSEAKQSDLIEQSENISLVGPTIGKGEPPDKRNRTSFRWELWALEFGCILISMGSLFAIIGVLRAYDQSPLPQLPFQITLNSYLAFLTTLAKAALMPPVAEALSQVKWNWFHVDRPLEDIQIFDAASRGTFGSLAVLIKMNCGVMAKLGALVMALGLFTSPVTQQLIEYPTRLVSSPHGQATIPIIQQVQITNNFITLPYAALELAVTTGLTSTKPVESIPPDCPTSNCTFPQFDSLGFCVKTEDITDLLIVDEIPNAPSSDLNRGSSFYQDASIIPMYNLTLTEDCNMITQSPYSFQACVQGSNRSLAFKDELDLMPTSLFSIFYIFQAPKDASKNEIKQFTPTYRSAVEVLVSLCVQTFEVSVSTGITETKRVSTISEIVPKPYQHSLPGKMNCSIEHTSRPSHCKWPPDNMVNLEDMFFLANPRKPGSDLDQDLYGTTYGFLVNLGQVMTATIPGSFAWMSAESVAVKGPLEQVNPLETLLLGDSPVDANMLFSTVESMYNNMSIALTNQLRMLQPYNGSQNSFLINGTAWEPETYVSIRWGWITLLVAQVVFGTACFGFAMWQSHRLGIPVLKSSALAMVFALGDESRVPHGIESIERVRERTSKIQVRLRDGELVRTDLRAE